MVKHSPLIQSQESCGSDMATTAQYNNPRRSERIHRRMPITLVVKSQGKQTTHTVSTVNLSKHGVRIQSSLPLNPGQAVFAWSRKATWPTGYFRVVWAEEDYGPRKVVEAGLEAVN